MITLQKANLEMLPSYMACMNEFLAHGEKVWGPNLPLEEEAPELFIKRFFEREMNPPQGLVPETNYWICYQNEVVGRISFRHFLNENLKEFGGHIGYEIRPSYRRQGFAKAALKELLNLSEIKKVGEVLLTCAPDNEASKKTIVANGGALVKTQFVEKWNRMTNYYTIKTL